MMDDEKRAELVEQVEAFRAVDEMVKTTGWKKFVIPRIEGLRAASEQKLMEAKELPEFIKAQQTIIAIDALLTSLMMDIKTGEEAAEELSKEKPKETEE